MQQKCTEVVTCPTSPDHTFVPFLCLLKRSKGTSRGDMVESSPSHIRCQFFSQKSWKRKVRHPPPKPRRRARGKQQGHQKRKEIKRQGILPFSAPWLAFVTIVLLLGSFKALLSLRKALKEGMPQMNLCTVCSFLLLCC